MDGQTPRRRRRSDMPDNAAYPKRDAQPKRAPSAGRSAPPRAGSQGTKAQTPQRTAPRAQEYAQTSPARKSTAPRTNNRAFVNDGRNISARLPLPWEDDDSVVPIQRTGQKKRPGETTARRNNNAGARGGGTQSTRAYGYGGGSAQGAKKSAAPRRKNGGGNARPPRKPKSNIGTYFKWALALIVITGIGIAAYSGFSYVKNIQDVINLGEGVFYPNLYVNNIHIGGMTYETARATVQAQVEQQAAAFSIELRTTDGQAWKIDKGTLNMQYDVEDQITQLWRVGREGNSEQRYNQIMEIAQTPMLRYTTLTYDLTGVSGILSQIKTGVDKEPVNATRIADNTRFPPFGYTSEELGYSLDVTSAYETISGMIDRLESGTVVLEPTVIQPQITRALLEAQITQIGYYETAISTSSTEGRTANVDKGCQYFNYMTVAHNARVSFNDTTGKRTQRNGWHEALEIAYGEYTTGYGGGICQVSSTLYNACVSAGLEIMKRSQHGLVVSYVDKGLDATVSDSGKDFIFRNNTGGEIYIEAGIETRGKRKYCVFKIYGRANDEGKTYKLDGRITEELPIPEEVIRVDEDKDGDGRGDLYGLTYRDETKLASKGSVGYKVSTYKITMVNGVPMEEEYLYTDTFNAIAPVRYTGSEYRD